MAFRIEKVTAVNQRDIIFFLSQYQSTAIFLLGNLIEHGPNLGLHVNSGNYKLLKKNDKIICVFCLTRRGNLLIQSELIYPVFESIVASIKQESPLLIRGLIGEWKFAKAFWQYLKNNKLIKKDTFYSKEINYELNLATFQQVATNEARFLEVNDYLKWQSLKKNYLTEQMLPIDLDDNQMYEQFIEKCKKLMIWGLFIESQLISIAELNAKTEAIATVGSVYTVPKFRRQGFAKKLMHKLIFDCKNTLLLHKLFIFTGENENKPAQKLYGTIGCSKVGYMALFFGE